MVVAIARCLSIPAEVWLVSRRVQLVWVGVLAWSLLIRIALRRGLFLPEAPRLLLLASDDEIGVRFMPGAVWYSSEAETASPEDLENLE